MQSQRTVAIDLPQKFLVYENDEGVFVAYNSAEYLQERHDIEGEMQTLEQIAGALSNFADAATAEIPGVQAGDVTVYEVTVTNLMLAGQPLSPPVATTHSADVVMFRLGETASEALNAIAQSGDPMPMVELLEGLETGITDVVNVGRPLTPAGTAVEVEGNEVTDSATFTITAASGDFLSLATMLICTNDGFTGLDSAELPTEGAVTFELNAYDSGVEENTELSEDIVDPCSALGPITLDGDPNGNVNDGDVLTDPVGVIAPHENIQGVGDLDVEGHGWTDPVVSVTITNTGEVMDGDMMMSDDMTSTVSMTDSMMATDTDTMTDSEMMTDSETMMTPSVAVEEQAVENGTVTVPEVVAAEAGWIVIHADNGSGAPGPVIGQTAVEVGINSDVVVEIDADAATDTLHAMLHVDAGEAGVYEFPGDDVPVRVDGTVVNEPFNAAMDEAMIDGNITEIDIITPSITVENQPLTDDVVVVPTAYSAVDGWLVIHASADGAPGPVIGQTAVIEGVNSDVEIEIDTEGATEQLFAMLHVDEGEIGTYEFPGADVPVTLDGEVVVEAFTVSMEGMMDDEMMEMDDMTDTMEMTDSMEMTDAEAMDDEAMDEAMTAEVTMAGFAYDPVELTVDAGTTVTWVNGESVRHTVTADDDSFDSGDMQEGDTFSMTFDEPGEYPYYCVYHGGPDGVGMAGVIVVE